MKINEKKNLILLLVFFIALSGCKTIILKAYYGYKNPEPENEESILKCA